MDKQYIDILTKIGEKGVVEKENERVLENVDGHYINYIENWRETINLLSDIELVTLFKGIVIAEKHFSWRSGSVAAGVWFYREIEERRLDEDLQIANWAFINTSNGYIPFGSNGAIRQKSKSAFEYLQNSQTYSHQIEIEKEKKESRLLNQKIDGLKNIISQKENEINDLKKRLELTRMTSIEIADIIINDNTKPVYFYYHEIEKIINDKSVDKKLLENILSKFKEKEKKNIKVLKNKLIEEITNR